MKVLHIIDSLRSGGRERQLIEFIKGLKRIEDIMVQLVVLSDDISYAYVKDLQIKIHYLIRKNKKDPRICLELYRVCKEFKPNIIHS
jgi:hypothetical protein